MSSTLFSDLFHHYGLTDSECARYIRYEEYLSSQGLEPFRIKQALTTRLDLEKKLRIIKGAKEFNQHVHYSRRNPSVGSRLKSGAVAVPLLTLSSLADRDSMCSSVGVLTERSFEETNGETNKPGPAVGSFTDRPSTRRFFSEATSGLTADVLSRSSGEATSMRRRSLDPVSTPHNQFTSIAGTEPRRRHTLDALHSTPTAPLTADELTMPLLTLPEQPLAPLTLPHLPMERVIRSDYVLADSEHDHRSNVSQEGSVHWRPTESRPQTSCSTSSSCSSVDPTGVDKMDEYQRTINRMKLQDEVVRTSQALQAFYHSNPRNPFHSLLDHITLSYRGTKYMKRADNLGETVEVSIYFLDDDETLRQTPLHSAVLEIIVSDLGTEVQKVIGKTYVCYQALSHLLADDIERAREQFRLRVMQRSHNLSWSVDQHVDKKLKKHVIITFILDRLHMSYPTPTAECNVYLQLDKVSIADRLDDVLNGMMGRKAVRTHSAVSTDAICSTPSTHRIFSRMMLPPLLPDSCGTAGGCVASTAPDFPAASDNDSTACLSLDAFDPASLLGAL